MSGETLGVSDGAWVGLQEQQLRRSVQLINQPDPLVQELSRAQTVFQWSGPDSLNQGMNSSLEAVA
jgi:hypothetical protein